MKSLEDLKKIREAALGKIHMRKEEDENTIRVVVGMATCGIAAGARPVLAACLDEVQKRKLDNVSVTQTGCIGVCRLEPIVEVFAAGAEKVTYVKMDAEKIRRVIAEHIVNKQIVSEYTIGAAE